MKTDLDEVSAEAAEQPRGEPSREPNKISAATKHSFTGRNLTAYGGLLPVAAMLEKPEFRELVGASVNLELERMPRAMKSSDFLLAMILAVYVGFSRLNHLPYLEPEPMLLGILRVARLPMQSTFWRFLPSLHLSVERQLGSLNARLRERVWAAANVRLKEVTLDTDTTVHTLYGDQMGGRVSYNRKNKGKPSYQPMLAFIAETREFAGGRLHNGGKPSGESIARHLARVIETLPKTVETLRARADAGFYCWDAVKAYTELQCDLVIVARKTDRLLGELLAAEWRSSSRTDADFACQFSDQPEGWEREYRFVGLRYDEPEPDANNPDQIGLFDGLAWRYRVFVTNIGSEKWSPAEVVAFYNKRAAVENLIN
ncbi:MAG: transposase [Acidobacteria bacterium]|nr:transposase [Acidobacteriota bacterium]